MQRYHKHLDDYKYGLFVKLSPILLIPGQCPQRSRVLESPGSPALALSKVVTGLRVVNEINLLYMSDLRHLLLELVLTQNV